MSTRSNIGFQNKNGSFTFVYCHFDGYFEGVGCQLLTDFNSYGKAEKLVLGGDMSTLTKPYDNNGEPLQTDYLGNCFNQEFAYVFMNGEWHACADGVQWTYLKERVLGSKGEHANVIVEFLQINGDKLGSDERAQYRDTAMYEATCSEDMLQMMKDATASRKTLNALREEAKEHKTNPVANLIETIIGEFIYYNREV